MIDAMEWDLWHKHPRVQDHQHVRMAIHLLLASIAIRMDLSRYQNIFLADLLLVSRSRCPFLEQQSMRHHTWKVDDRSHQFRYKSISLVHNHSNLDYTRKLGVVQSLRCFVNDLYIHSHHQLDLPHTTVIVQVFSFHFLDGTNNCVCVCVRERERERERKREKKRVQEQEQSSSMSERMHVV